MNQQVLSEWPDELDNTTIVRSDRAIFRTVDDGSGLVLHLDTADYYGLNQVGSLIWDLLEGGTTWESLIGDLKDNLDEPPPELETDTADFLKELHDRQLVVLSVQG